MFKVISRFGLLLVLCFLLVYAPEILSSVSAPYTIATPQRVLLHVALQGNGETYDILHRIMNDYQKLHPHVHLRVMHVGENLFQDASGPYPDVILCSQAMAAQLPPGFASSEALSMLHADSFLHCAFSQDSAQPQVAAEFAAYIYGALSAQNAPPEI